MNCPGCNSELVEMVKHGVVLDNCTSCGGVWLDAGEFETASKLEKGGLDKLFSVFKK